ncbi:MAG: hypothetical protein FWE72_01275 [Spirochaetaceae bacterium]|nr:hypothetical protein [Spirochaetaceae bacterium]
MKKIIIFLLIFFIFFSCGNKKSFLEDFEKIMSEKQGDQLLNALLDLDKKYPEKLRTKVNIAAIYLGMEKPELAELFLEKGIETAKKSRERDEKYIFYANYSEYLFHKGNFSESLKMGMSALGSDDYDPAGVSLTIAQIHISEKKNNEAILFFKKAWGTNVNIFTAQDLFAFYYILSIAQEAEDYISLMVSIVDEIKLKSPDVRGYGFQQAEILDQVGASVSSLIAIFSEIEFLRLYNDLSNEEILKSIDLLYEKNEESHRSLKIIEGYRSFINEEWNIAEAIFTEITPEVPIVFYNYLRLASMLQSGLGTEDVFYNYLQLSRYFSKLQGYSFNLWNGIKKGSVKYDDSFIESVLRNCILIFPNSEYATLSRIELGNLHEIAQGEKIILVDEVFYYIDSVIKEGSMDILEPIAVMLEMDDNIFIDDAMELIQEAVKDKRVGDWFKRRSQKGNDKIKARISAII